MITRFVLVFWATVTFCLATWGVSSALFDGQRKRLLKRLGLAILWPLALFSHGGISGLWRQFKDVY